MTRDFSSRPRSGAEPSRLDWILLAGAAAALLASLWSWSDARSTVRKAQGDVVALRAEVARLRGRSPAVPRSADARSVPPDRVVADVAELLPADVRLDSLTITYGATVDLEMSVVARRAADYEAFLDRLGRSLRLANTTPGDESYADEVAAVVRARYEAVR